MMLLNFFIGISHCRPFDHSALSLPPTHLLLLLRTTESNLWYDSSWPLDRQRFRYLAARTSIIIYFSRRHCYEKNTCSGWVHRARILWEEARKWKEENELHKMILRILLNWILPAISFSAERANHRSSRYLWSSFNDLMRRSIFGSKNLRNILLALAEINLKSFGVRLIGNDELCHCMYLL